MSESERPIRDLLQNALIALGVEEGALRAATLAEVERLCGVAEPVAKMRGGR